MRKAVNDATLTKLGDIYQYYIALHDCFGMENDETLLIEVNGDISVITVSTGRFQKEVKHHLDIDFLLDRDIDFWKTLANWYCDYERIKSFTQLILYTTSQIRLDSSWIGWNNNNSTEKLAILKRIGAEVKPKEANFRKQFIRIFNGDVDEKKLADILSKNIISSAHTNISKISIEFEKYIGYIPIENRDSYIAALLGQILAKVKDPPHKWEVTKKGFELILQNVSPGFSLPGQKPLPVDYADAQIPKEEEKKITNKRFINAIRAIEHDIMIPKAMSDYWRSDMTIIRYFQDDLLYLRDLQRYKNSLGEKLFFEKDNARRQAHGESPKKCVDLSKNFYNSSMLWNATDFGSIIRNQEFFQRGIIHNIIDEGGIDWKIGDQGGN